MQLPKLALLSVIILCSVAGFAFLYVSGQRPITYLSQAVNTQQDESIDDNSVPLQLTEVATNLSVPWSIAFTDESRILVTERKGTVRVISNNQLQPEPIHTFTEVQSRGEEGLMGMTLDPQYDSNKYIYFVYAYPKDQGYVDKVVRLTDAGDQLVDQVVIIDGIPASVNHAGSRIKFGPDGKLYVSTGDAQQRALAQDKNSLAGKLLRLNLDGSIPDDNPFPDSPIFSYGHRNSQGFDWHPVTQTLYATEHGPSGNDGPGGGDEINIITAGGNYGWPLVSHARNQADLIAPVQLFTPAVAPASGIFYRSDLIPQFTNNFLFGALRGEGLYLIKVDQTDTTKTKGYEKIEEVKIGRVRDVVEGPDGALYLTTSNQDGRGRARQGDDKVYRLAPSTAP